MASIARLEAQANVEAQNNPEVERDRDDAEFAEHGCRLAYSSYLAVSNREEAKQLLAAIFTTALLRNPAKAIGGMLFYDEATSCIVQVLEGPAQVTRELFSKIEVDPRHTSVKKLWDIDVETRRFDGFGMKLGASASDAKTALDASPGHNTGREELLKLTYMSQLAAATRDIAYEHIESILAVAIVTNPKLHIGGALVSISAPLCPAGSAWRSHRRRGLLRPSAAPEAGLAVEPDGRDRPLRAERRPLDSRAAQFLNPRTLHVVQVLEGPQRAVRALYEKIATDTRHNQCVVLSDELVHARTYDQWGMLQGNLADWSALAAGGWATGSSLQRRMRRNGKARDDETELEQPTAAQAALLSRLQAAEVRADEAEERARKAEARAEAAIAQAVLAEARADALAAEKKRGRVAHKPSEKAKSSESMSERQVVLFNEPPRLEVDQTPASAAALDVTASIEIGPNGPVVVRGPSLPASPASPASTSPSRFSPASTSPSRLSRGSSAPLSHIKC